MLSTISGNLWNSHQPLADLNTNSANIQISDNVVTTTKEKRKFDQITGNSENLEPAKSIQEVSSKRFKQESLVVPDGKRKFNEIDDFKESLTPTKFTKKKSTKRPKKTPRTFKDISEAPSARQEETDKVVGKSNPKLLREHAHMRVHLFALAVVGLHGIAIRSDNSEDRKFSFSLISAYLQVGKAINGKGKLKNQVHAAHDNAAAGYIDNSRDRVIQTIAEDLKITPQKMKKLIAKGFSAEDLKEIQENCHDFNKLTEIFDRIWPVNPLKPQSIFTGTQTDLTLNSITEVEKDANLVVDKWIELLRPKIEELYEKIIYAKITQEEATIQFRELIIEHLLRFEVSHTKNQATLDKYEETFLKLEKYKNLESNEVTDVINLLRELEKELNPPKIKKSNLFFQDPLTKNPRVKLPNNHRFLNKTAYTLQKDFIECISTWTVQKFDLLKKEFQSQKEKIMGYINISMEQRAGTKVPDFTSLFGEFNPDTKKRELSDETLSRAQQRTWKPIPFKI